MNRRPDSSSYSVPSPYPGSLLKSTHGVKAGGQTAVLCDNRAVILLGYLLRAVLARLALAVPALAAVYLAFDLGDEGRRLAAHLGWSAVLRASLLHLPLVTVQIAPAALLLAALLAIGALRRRGELEAMATAGAGPLRLGAPLLLIGAGAALCALLLDEIVVPPCERAADLLYQGRRASSLTGLRLAPRWARQRSWFLHRRDGEVLALQLDDGHRITQRIEGRLGAHGELRDARAVRFAADGQLLRQGASPLPAALALLATQEQPRAEARSFTHLHRTLAALAEAGQVRAPEELVLHTKLAFPLLNLVVALLAWPLVLRHDRRSGTTELAVGLGQIFLLWALLAGGWTAGRVGWLSPAVAVWAPTAAGLALGGLLLLRAVRRHAR